VFCGIDAIKALAQYAQIIWAYMPIIFFLKVNLIARIGHFDCAKVRIAKQKTLRLRFSESSVRNSANTFKITLIELRYIKYYFNMMRIN
jgi:hypothetical protein